MTHPAERYQGSMKELRTRATLASVALALTACVHVYAVGARAWSIQFLRGVDPLDAEAQRAALEQLVRADSMVNIADIATLLMLAATAIVFLRWVHRFALLAWGLGASQFTWWSPSYAVWAFIIPFVNVVRPYKVLIEIERGIDPADILEPPPRAERGGPAGYRGATFTIAPPPKHVPRALIGLWWGTWLASNFLAWFAPRVENGEGIAGVVQAYNVVMISEVLSVFAAVLAINVVLRLTGRLEERFRRIRFTEPEALEKQVTLR